MRIPPGRSRPSGWYAGRPRTATLPHGQTTSGQNVCGESFGVIEPREVAENHFLGAHRTAVRALWQLGLHEFFLAVDVRVDGANSGALSFRQDREVFRPRIFLLEGCAALQHLLAPLLMTIFVFRFGKRT